MRHLYVVSYDISDPKRLRRTFKCMRAYGDPLQYSVFRCELNRQERIRLESDLLPIINHEADQVMLINLGPAQDPARKRFATLGRAILHSERHAVVF